MSRDAFLYLDELVEAAECACRFAEGLQRGDYQPGQMAFEAIVRQIEIIGESAAHVPLNLREKAKDIPWDDLVGMRNRLIHGYFAIDSDVVWSVVHDKLPELIPAIKKLLAEQT